MPTESQIIRYRVFIRNPDGEILARANAAIEVTDVLNAEKLANTKEALEIQIGQAYLDFEWVVSEETHEQALETIRQTTVVH